MKKVILKLIHENIKVKTELLKKCITDIEQISQVIISSCLKGNKIIVFGNGGSAADAQHFAAELVSRFEAERRPIDAIALTTDTSILTSIGNDYAFKYIFSRQVEAIVKHGDVSIGISTSGNSVNVIEGIKSAKKHKAVTIGLTGKTGGKLKSIVDYYLCVPSDNTARIQESHILVLHIICSLLEKELLKVK